jgi:hypothetical protein
MGIMPTIIHMKCGSNKSWMKTTMMEENVHLLTLPELLDNLNKASQENDPSTLHQKGLKSKEDNEGVKNKSF